MPGALTHIKIIWIFSPIVPQVLCMGLDSPLCLSLVRTPHVEVCDNLKKNTRE